MRLPRPILALTALLPAAGMLLLADPAQAATPSPNLVISQVFGGGGNSGSHHPNDFVELFNRGTTPVTINGDSIQYASSSGSIDPTKLTPLTFNGTLAPDQHFFVEGNNNGATVDGTEPTPDVNNPNLAISKSDFTIFLTNSTTPLTSPTDSSIIDEVGRRLS